jgi:hypothetical protein
VKALEVQRCLAEQRRRYGKHVFTPTELAHMSGSSMATTRVELCRLRKLGVIEQYAHGRYGLPGGATPEGLVRSLDVGAYISGAYALYAHGLVTQLPRVVTCITNKRHNRSRVRETSVGRIEFVCVSANIYAPPAQGDLAGAEQALCDYVYLMRRRGIDVRTQVTLRGLAKLDAAKLKEVRARYPRAVQDCVTDVAGGL